MRTRLLRLVENRSPFLTTFTRWFDSWAGVQHIHPNEPQRVDWFRCLPFAAMHLMCITVLWVGWSWTAVSVAVSLYAVRMFAITALYHRYFSHKAFKTSRFCQFIFALLGTASVQRGPLWWAAHHRHHHAASDQAHDVHSPRQQGFWWSHMGWFTAKVNFPTKLHLVRDLAKYPELCFLDRFDVIVAVLLATSLYGLGAVLATFAPALGTNGMQMLVWGFFISTVVLYHATYTINSLSHCFGRTRYKTQDDSKNNLWLALITFGEGWHNNHHFYPAAARQGFYWWEIDLSYYVLLLLSWVGLIWDLKPVPPHVRNTRKVDVAAAA